MLDLESPQTVFDMLTHRALVSPSEIAFVEQRMEGDEQETSTCWSLCLERARWVAAALLQSKVKSGDCVGFLGEGSGDWLSFNAALAAIGALSISLAPRGHSSRHWQIIEGSGAKILFVEGAARLTRFLAAHTDFQVERIVYLPLSEEEAKTEFPFSEDQRVMGYQEFVEMGKTQSALDLLELIPQVLPENPAVLLFSTTSKESPGITCLTHTDLYWASLQLSKKLPLASQDRHLLWAPISSSLMRISLYANINSGTATLFRATSTDLLLSTQCLQPTLISALPSGLERLWTRLLPQVSAGSSFRRRTWRWFAPQEQRSIEESWWPRTWGSFGSRFFFQRARRSLGGSLRGLIALEGAVTPSAERFFLAAKIPIAKLYGVQEHAGFTHFRGFQDPPTEAVGEPLEGVQVALSESREILLEAGPILRSVCLASRSQFLEWSGESKEGEIGEESKEDEMGDPFSTGDLGVFNEEGLLCFSGKQSALIHLEDGRVINPYRCELLLRSHPLIREVFVFGEQRPYLTALIALDAATLHHFSQNIEAPEGSASWTQHQQVFEKIEEILKKLQRRLPTSEQIRKFAILEQPLTEFEGELASMLPLRKNIIGALFQGVLDSFYEERF